MSSKSRIKFSRRREGITDYGKRLGMLKARVPRLVVRQTNKKIIAQIVDFTDKGDYVVSSALSSDLAALGWKHSIKSVPAAYLTGMLVAARSKGKKADRCILDVGLKTLTKGSRIFAVLRGAIDGGLQIPHSPENFPSDDRVIGKHIADYRKADILKDFEAMKSKVASAPANGGQVRKPKQAKSDAKAHSDAASHQAKPDAKKKQAGMKGE